MYLLILEILVLCFEINNYNKYLLLRKNNKKCWRFKAYINGGLSKQFTLVNPFKFLLILSATKKTSHPLVAFLKSFTITAKFWKVVNDDKRKPTEIGWSHESHVKSGES